MKHSKSKIFRGETKNFQTHVKFQICIVLQWKIDSWLLFVLLITSTGRLKSKESKKIECE